MNKVKLTRQQELAMKHALSHYGDADYLVDIHRKMMNQGHEWSIWPALNEVTPNELHDALKYGYEVAGKVKVSREVANAIQFVRKGFKDGIILDAHWRNPRGWGLVENRALNAIDYNTLKQALEHGYEVDEQSSPKWKHVGSGVTQLPKLFPHPQCRHTVKRPQASTREELELELDYQLASLKDALERNDEAEIERCKQRLAEICAELGLAGEKHAI